MKKIEITPKLKNMLEHKVFQMMQLGKLTLFFKKLKL